MSTPQLHSEPFIHLVDVSHDRALIAWGAFAFRRDDVDGRWDIVDDEELWQAVGRRTCIGTDAESFGDAVVQVLDADGGIAAEVSCSETTWAWVHGLAADTEYRYRVIVEGTEWGCGERWDWVPSARGGYDLAPAGRHYDLRFRTWPAPDDPTPAVRFAALGDYGVGIRSDAESSRRQRRIADVLDRLVDDGVRFVISLGDNIYEGEQGLVDDESGGEDDDWYSSFFQPYRYAIARVPFFPAIGNHDTTDTEGADDRAQMEDNFHLSQRFRDDGGRSSVDPGLFYRLRYGRDLDLVCLDTSMHTEADHIHRFFQDPDHHRWLTEAFAPGGARWVIPFTHHPPFCAGPRHGNDEDMAELLLPLFAAGKIRLVLSGHEHNFQIGEVDGCTYVVSGAAGKLREDVPDGFGAAGTLGWAAQAHLLLVEIDGAEARVTPIAGLLPDGRPHVMTALTPDNDVLMPPFVVRAPSV